VLILLLLSLVALGLSCETQICATMYDILYSTDTHQTVSAAVLNLNKVFDRVPHTLLMKKLSKIADFDECIIHWILVDTCRYRI